MPRTPSEFGLPNRSQPLPMRPLHESRTSWMSQSFDPTSAGVSQWLQISLKASKNDQVSSRMVRKRQKVTECLQKMTSGEFLTLRKLKK